MITLKGQVVSVHKYASTCKLLVKPPDFVDESGRKLFKEKTLCTVNYSTLAFLGISVPEIELKDWLNIENPDVKHLPDGMIVFCSNSSVLKVPEKLAVNSVRSPWTQAFDRIIVSLGVNCLSHYGWLLSYVTIIADKLGILVRHEPTDMQFLVRMAFDILTGCCGLKSLKFQPHQATQLTTEDSAEMLPALAQLEDEISCHSQPATLFPNIVEITKLTSQDHVSEWGFEQIDSQSVQTLLGVLGACSNSARPLLRDASGHVYIVFLETENSVLPNLSWLGACCIVRNFEVFHEKFDNESMVYIAVKPCDVQIISCLPRCQLANHVSHEAVILNRSRLHVNIHKPSMKGFLLDVMVKATDKVDANVKVRHRKLSLCLEGNEMLSIRPYLYPGSQITICLPDLPKWKYLCANTSVYWMKSDGCLRLSRAQHGLRITNGSFTHQICSHELRQNVDGSCEGVIDDVYRNKKNNFVNLRVTLSTSGLKTSVYCDIAALHFGNPLGLIPGMKVRITNLVKKMSGSGNHYYVATAMSDFFVSPKVSHSELLWPLVSLSRLLPDKLACVRFLLISFKPWFPVEFEAVCDSCSQLVPNESLEGPNCDTCPDSGWVLTASGKFVVSDGTCSKFVLEAKNEQVLQLLGIKGGFVKDFKTFVRSVRVFHLSHRNHVLFPSVLEESSEFAAKKRMAMQKLLMNFRPKNGLIVAAKCLLFQQTSGQDGSGIEGSTFWGRLYCQNVEEVTDFVEIPSDWVRSEEATHEAESMPFDISHFSQ
ncbi:unnamed protein product [Notodromas monacha]|uniref:CST complex subunit CTC1 n=1 Tax=Notodromas monacha TaxID=399045 RepID=A0A7R9GEK1_9CRUS|nr:unnamed protein product [Notodromas monacha]CAG0918141.1 unnamed protein product [Notodromas monacha]